MSSQYGAFSSKEDEGKKRTIPDRVLIRRVYQYVRPYRRHFWLGVTAIILGSLTGLASPYMHKLAIDQIIQTKNLSGFIWWIPLFVSVVLVNYYLQYIQIFQMRVVGENAVARIRDEIMEKLQVVSLRYFSEGEIGRILSRPINDANTLRIFLRMGFTSVLLDSSSIIGAFLIMFFLDLRLAVIALAILPVAVTIVWYMGKYSRSAYRKALSSLSGLTGRMQEDLAGIKVTQAFVQESARKGVFDKRHDETINANRRAIRISASYQPMVIILRLVGTMLILWYGTNFVLSGDITIGTLVAFIEYQFSYFMPLIDLIAIYDQYQSAMAAIERLFDLTDTQVEVLEAQHERRVELG
jgi:ABC-type multidrug transport system fused ATPase/permease subunit